MGLCYGQKGDYQQAIKLVGSGWDGHAPTSAAGYFYGRSRQIRQARDALANLINLEFPSIHIARVLAGLGENDQALAWLDRAVDQRDERVVMLKVDPHFDNLRSDPRFQALLTRIGLL